MGNGAGFKDWVLALAGNIFIVILAVRAIGAYAKKEWGELVVNLLAAVVIAGLVYFTDGAVNILKQLWGLITGA